MSIPEESYFDKSGSDSSEILVPLSYFDGSDSKESHLSDSIGTPMTKSKKHKSKKHKSKKHKSKKHKSKRHDSEKHKSKEHTMKSVEEVKLTNQGKRIRGSPRKRPLRLR